MQLLNSEMQLVALRRSSSTSVRQSFLQRHCYFGKSPTSAYYQIEYIPTSAYCRIRQVPTSALGRHSSTHCSLVQSLKSGMRIHAIGKYSFPLVPLPFPQRHFLVGHILTTDCHLRIPMPTSSNQFKIWINH